MAGCLVQHSSVPFRRDELYGCWLYTGDLDKDGYGMHRGSRAHRWVYEQLVGDVPEGLELEHICRRRSCVNPAHLEPVTRSENERRKSWSRRSKQKHCGKGHDLFLDGAVTPEGGKVCLRCSGVR